MIGRRLRVGWRVQCRSSLAFKSGLLAGSLLDLGVGSLPGFYEPKTGIASEPIRGIAVGFNAGFFVGPESDRRRDSCRAHYQDRV